jgi:hypothetical protein
MEGKITKPSLKSESRHHCTCCINWQTLKIHPPPGSRLDYIQYRPILNHDFVWPKEIEFKVEECNFVYNNDVQSKDIFTYQCNPFN